MLSVLQLEKEQTRITDSYTDELFDCKPNLTKKIVFPVSRLAVDPERLVDDEEEPMYKYGMGVIYSKTSGGQILRKHLSAAERLSLITKYYDPHHSKLAKAVRVALAAHNRCLIIDCHSFPSKPFAYEQDQSPNRPDICIGTDAFHTPAWLKDLAVRLFEKQGFSVAVNKPFAGAIVPLQYYKVNADVFSIMIELNRVLYLRESSGTRNEEFISLKIKLNIILTTLIREVGSK